MHTHTQCSIMSSSLFRLTCQPNDCEMLRNILGEGPRCICCTGIVIYRCIRQQHNDNWFFPRSNRLSDHALPWRRSAQHFPTLDTFCPTLPYRGDVLPNTFLPWRRSAQHFPTLGTFCPILPYIGDVLPHTALPWIRSAQHLPTLETFCPTLPYFGDVLPHTTLDTFCPTLPYLWNVLSNTALHWRRSVEDIFMVVLICVACAMFSGDRCHQDILATKSFTYWTNTTSVLDGRAKKLYRTRQLTRATQ